MKKLYRSKDNYILGGIFGGLGDYWEIDPVFIRLIAVFLGIISGVIPILIFYVIALLVIPYPPQGYQPASYPKIYRSEKSQMIAGICGGLSERFNIDAVMIRLLFLALCFVTAVAPMVITYLFGWAIIPLKIKPKEVEIEVQPKD